VGPAPKGWFVQVSSLIRLYGRFAHLIHELAKFGSIGAASFVVTMGCANLFHGVMHMGPLTSTGLAIVVATIFAYFANRHWTFKHLENSGLRRELILFFILNGVGLVITEIFVGFNHYAMDNKSKLAYNVALVVGTGVATIFRYWSYKKWVFLSPATAQPTEGRTAEDLVELPEVEKTPESVG
jgi:putative flippase GtrA